MEYTIKTSDLAGSITAGKRSTEPEDIGSSDLEKVLEDLWPRLHSVTDGNSDTTQKKFSWVGRHVCHDEGGQRISG